LIEWRIWASSEGADKGANSKLEVKLPWWPFYVRKLVWSPVFYFIFGYVYSFHLDFTFGPQFREGPNSPSLWYFMDSTITRRRSFAGAEKLGRYIHMIFTLMQLAWCIQVQAWIVWGVLCSPTRDHSSLVPLRSRLIPYARFPKIIAYPLCQVPQG
jgi:hypothetical protein